MPRGWKHILVTCTTIGVIVSVLLAVTSHSKVQEMAQAVGLPEVEVVQVAQQDVPITSEWIGTLAGMVNATIKAQVTGYLRKQNCTEGAFVTQGQVLFEIDPRPFQAALDQAKGELAKAQGQLVQANAQLMQANAQLAQAEANQGKTQLDVDRYIPLAKAAGHQPHRISTTPSRTTSRRRRKSPPPRRGLKWPRRRLWQPRRWWRRPKPWSPPPPSISASPPFYRRSMGSPPSPRRRSATWSARIVAR